MERIPLVPFGVARTETFMASGLSRRQFRALVGHGLRKLGRGWYATEEAHRDVQSAIQHGGRLSCLSALSLFHRAWSPPGQGVHVRLLEGTSRGRTKYPRLPRAVHNCQSAGPQRMADFGPVDPPELAVPAAGQCTSAEYFVAVLDSLLHAKECTVEELAHWLRHTPSRIASLLDHTDVAESGTESLVRFRLRQLGLPVRPQVWILDVGRVDLVVGERFVIECDSVGHHDSPGAFHNDRERDLALAQQDYERLRLTYHQIVDDWDRALQAIMTIVSTGAHLRKRTPWAA